MFWVSASVAVTAAVRSTWSPCGLSMMSTITPLAERARGRRYGLTALWFILGATLGGLVTGALAAVLAVAVASTSATAAGLAAVGSVAALAAGAADLGLLGRPLPHLRRQVNEQWLEQFRSWVYGAGFGLQIGSGFMTYIMTAAVYLVVVLAALLGSPAGALLIGGLFGLVRGSAILLTARARTPGDLMVVHRWFESARPSVRNAVIVVELGASLVLGVIAGWAVPVAVAVCVLCALAMRRAVRTRGRVPIAPPVEMVT